MNDNDVLALLIYANELDGRHSPNELKVRAWREVFDSEAPGMTVDFAKDQVTRHYAITDVMLSPVVLVTAWKQHSRTVSESRLVARGASEAHCGRPGCDCVHSDGCFKGWLDRDDSVAACPICRPTLADALYKMPPPGQRSERDFSVLRNRMWGNDE